MNSIHRSSSGCHVAHGDVAPETVVSNTIGETHKICLLAIRQWGGHRRSCRASGSSCFAWHGRPASLPCAGLTSSWRVCIVAFRCCSLGAVGDCGSGDEGCRRR
jgi:hypothetical protein